MSVTLGNSYGNCQFMGVLLATRALRKCSLGKATTIFHSIEDNANALSLNISSRRFTMPIWEVQKVDLNRLLIVEQGRDTVLCTYHAQFNSIVLL